MDRLYIVMIPVFGLLIVHRADKLVQSIREKRKNESTFHACILVVILAVASILVAVIEELCGR